jgi:hypothetical protein
LVYLLFSALLASVVNFLLRRNFEKGGSANAFLSLYFLSSLVLIFLIYPQLWSIKISPVMISLGCFAGFLNFLMMGLTTKTVQTGPPGLSFTFQNASSVMPGLLLYFLFGPAFGFRLSFWLCLGFVFILTGLYLSTRTVKRDVNGSQTGSEAALTQEVMDLKKWLGYAVSMLLVQGVILSIFQWRLLLLNDPPYNHWLIPWSCSQEEDLWFIPAFFLIPTILQLLNFWKTEKRKFTSLEFRYGAGAGILNCVVMILLLLATKNSGFLEKAMQFPLFTVAVILFCNLWGWKIYEERVNWVGISLCVMGVIVGFI